MPQHPLIGVCALSSPNGVCSPFGSGCAKIKQCKKRGFWDITRVNTGRAVPGGSGQTPGCPNKCCIGASVWSGTMGKRIRPHLWCPQPGDVSQRCAVSIHSPFPGAALGTAVAEAAPGADHHLAPAFPRVSSPRAGVVGDSSTALPHGVWLQAGRKRAKALPQVTSARCRAGCWDPSLGHGWVQGQAGAAGARGSPALCRGSQHLFQASAQPWPLNTAAVAATGERWLGRHYPGNVSRMPARR